MAEEISAEKPQEPENLDPQCVVDVFVKKYYAILETSPDIVHKFYKDESVIKRPGPDGTMESVTTMQNISDTIMSSDYKGVYAEILNADFQESVLGGIIVAVNGYLILNNDTLRRKSFYQTFFLARQEKGFFVLNDILRFTDAPHEESTPSACSDTTKCSLSVHLMTPAPENASILEPTDASVVEDDVKKVSEVKDDIKKVSEVKDDIKKVSEVKKSPTPVAQIPKEPSTPKTSYASMVAKPSKVTAPTTTVSVAVKIGSTAEQQQPKANHGVPSINAAKGLNSSNNGTENNGSNGDAMTRSVYIGNLPSNITKNGLIDALKEFGSVKQDGIQLRTFEDGFCFGFVEFESASSARKAVDVHNYTIGGKDAYILFKRSSARSGEFHGNGVNGSRQNGENNFNNRNQISRDNTNTRGSYGRESYRTNEKRSNGEAYPRQKDDRLINGGDGFQGGKQQSKKIQ